jgi:hypothetical protein
MFQSWQDSGLAQRTQPVGGDKQVYSQMRRSAGELFAFSCLLGVQLLCCSGTSHASY